MECFKLHGGVRIQRNQLSEPMKLLIWIPVVCIGLVLGGCVAPVPKMVETASGKPEIVINSDLASIKSAIINELVNHNYTVEEDTDYMLRMSRPLDASENLIAAMTVGNSYSVNKRLAVYQFIKLPEGYRVLVSPSMTSQMPGGQVNTVEISDNGDVFNTFQRGLIQIKATLENRPKSP